MAIVESFHPPIVLTARDQYDPGRAVREFRGCIIRRPLSAGMHDVTDHRATQMNRWKVDVQPQKDPVVYIIPTEKNSRVSMPGLPFGARAGGARVSKDEPVRLAGVTSERKWFGFIPLRKTYKLLLYRQVVSRSPHT